jgi:hypothetical protein
LGALGAFGAFGALGAFGAFGAFGALGALGALGAFGAFGALGALGDLVAAGSFVALRPRRLVVSPTKSLFAEAEATRAERKRTVVEIPVFIILDLCFHEFIAEIFVRRTS